MTDVKYHVALFKCHYYSNYDLKVFQYHLSLCGSSLEEHVRFLTQHQSEMYPIDNVQILKFLMSDPFYLKPWCIGQKIVGDDSVLYWISKKKTFLLLTQIIEIIQLFVESMGVNEEGVSFIDQKHPNGKKLVEENFHCDWLTAFVISGANLIGMDENHHYSIILKMRNYYQNQIKKKELEMKSFESQWKIPSFEVKKAKAFVFSQPQEPESFLDLDEDFWVERSLVETKENPPIPKRKEEDLEPLPKPLLKRIKR